MTLCQLEVGDTADWSLRYDGAAAALNRYKSWVFMKQWRIYREKFW